MSQCSDALDNDGDGLVDLADPQCDSASDSAEAQPGCGLGGEFIVMAAILLGLARRGGRFKRLR